MLWPNVSTGSDEEPETVTVKVRKPVTLDKYVTHSDVTAFRRAVRQELEGIEEGEISTAPTTFHLRASTLADGVIISQGCIIVDSADQQWNVVTANLELMDTRWRCIVVKGR